MAGTSGKPIKRMIKSFKKILIIHSWGIGDLVMFTPSLRILRDNFSDSQIDLLILGRKSVAQILLERQTVNRILHFYWNDKSFFEKLKLILRLRKEHYDLSIMTSRVNPAKGGILGFLLGAKTRAGLVDSKKKSFSYNISALWNPNQSVIDSNLALMPGLGLKADKRPEVFSEISSGSFKFVDEYLQKNHSLQCLLVGFHPGAEMVHRYLLWPKENYIKLGKEILKKHPSARIIVFCGPDEKDICQEIYEGIGERTILAQGLTINQVIALIDRCQVFVASDSGLGHLAATTKTNLISIFGPSDALNYGPSGPRVKIISAECRHLYDGKRDHTCLKRIAPEMVFQEAEKVLKERNHT